MTAPMTPLPIDVVVYTTNRCSYCRAAKTLLEQRGAPYREIDCSADPQIRQRLVEETGLRTVPQIYVGGVPIGGFDELSTLAQDGDLDKILSGQLAPVSIAVA